MPKGNSVQRVDEILIQVSDVQRSLKFYRDGLGIALKATAYGDDSFEANVGGVRFLIHPDFDGSLKNVHRGAGIHIHFWVPDADVYYALLRKRGIQVIEPPENRPWGRHLAVVDPDGYRIEILGPVKKAKRQGKGGAPTPAAKQ
ncbi:MAG: VOC family protein [Chloroflexi bacterium]|nr:VOC family protein [Chloroflexota bacterium]